jgi:hypothetical protein
MQASIILALALAICVSAYPLAFHAPEEDQIDGKTITADMVVSADVKLTPVDATMWEIEWTICAHQSFRLDRYAYMTIAPQTTQLSGTDRPPNLRVPLCMSTDSPKCSAQKEQSPPCLKGKRRTSIPHLKAMVDMGQGKVAVVLQDAMNFGGSVHELVESN